MTSVAAPSEPESDSKTLFMMAVRCAMACSARLPHDALDSLQDQPVQLLHHFPRQDHRARVEDVDEVRHAYADALLDLRHHDVGKLVSFHGRAAHLGEREGPVGIGQGNKGGGNAGGDELPDPGEDRIGGHQRLQAAPVSAFAQGPVLLHRDVSELTADAVLAPVDAVVQDDARPDSQPDVEEQEAVHVLHRPVPFFREGHAPHRVVQENVHAEPLCHQGGQAHVLPPREPRAVHHDPGAGIDQAGNTDADPEKRAVFRSRACPNSRRGFRNQALLQRTLLIRGRVGFFLVDRGAVEPESGQAEPAGLDHGADREPVAPGQPDDGRPSAAPAALELASLDEHPHRDQLIDEPLGRCDAQAAGI